MGSYSLQSPEIKVLKGGVTEEGTLPRLLFGAYIPHPRTRNANVQRKSRIPLRKLPAATSSGNVVFAVAIPAHGNPQLITQKTRASPEPSVQSRKPVTKLGTRENMERRTTNKTTKDRCRTRRIADYRPPRGARAVPRKRREGTSLGMQIACRPLSRLRPPRSPPCPAA